MARKKKIIGRREIVDFPGLEIFGIEVKIDTGAYTSSIHCKDVSEKNIDGIQHVTFTVLDEKHPQFSEKPLTCPVSRIRQVKNSFGQVEERFCIATQIKLFNELFDIELALADRSAMDYPVLLGRKAIKKRFMVDVSKVNCSQRKKKEVTNEN